MGVTVKSESMMCVKDRAHSMLFQILSQASGMSMLSTPSSSCPPSPTRAGSLLLNQAAFSRQPYVLKSLGATGASRGARATVVGSELICH